MPIETDKEIEDAITAADAVIDSNKEMSPDLASSRPYPGPGGRKYKGDPPYTERGSPLSSKYVFFYYMKFDGQGTLTTFVYRGEYQSTLDQQVGLWIDDARAGGGGAFTKNPDGVEWNRPCYLAMFLDNRGWKLIDHHSKQDASFSVHFSEDSNKLKPHKNKTFYGAMNRSVTPSDPSAGPVRYIAIENHHFLPDGSTARKFPPGPNQKAKDDYKFDLFFRVDMSGVTVQNDPNSPRLTLIIDPGGHNTGPDEDSLVPPTS